MIITTMQDWREEYTRCSKVLSTESRPEEGRLTEARVTEAETENKSQHKLKKPESNKEPQHKDGPCGGASDG